MLEVKLPKTRRLKRIIDSLQRAWRKQPTQKPISTIKMWGPTFIKRDQ